MGQGRGDVEVASDRAVAQPLASEGEDLVTTDLSPWPPEGLAEGSRPRESGPDTIADQGPLELPDGGHYMEDQLPGGGGGVDVFLDRDEGDPAAAQVFEALHELLDGPRSAVKALDDYDVELPLRRVRQESPEAIPILPGPRPDVAVGRDQFPAAANGVLPDLGELDLEVLPVGANSKIGRGARDSWPSHVTQPARFRGFGALPKGSNPVGATTAFGTRIPLTNLPSEHSAAYLTSHSAPVALGVKITRPLKILATICRASST